MDVNSPYTNIPHTDGVNTCRIFINWRNTDPASINAIPILILFVDTHNLFKSCEDHYLLIKCTATGTKMATAYANMSMDEIETLFLSASPLYRRLYYRYIIDR